LRKLASIREIKELHTIPKKDRIELAIIDGWSVIVKKGEYQVGDKTIYCEPDSLMPEKPEFEFLRDRKFRIKTMKMGGVISQGICFPINLLPNAEYSIGDDVTDFIGIKKYEKYQDEDSEKSEKDVIKNPLLKYILRYKIFRKIILPRKKNRGFPNFISKTDETRIQNIPHILKNKDVKYVVREKIDGQSGTFLAKRNKSWNPFSDYKFEYIVCSRNVRLHSNSDKSYWKVSNKYNLENVLKELILKLNVDWVCIQGECIDSKVQGNKYNVSEADLFVFNLITPNGKINDVEAMNLLAPYNLKWCPLIDMEYTLPDTVSEILDYATGESKLYNTLREGYVFRNYEENISFKAVSPQFLIKNDE